MKKRKHVSKWPTLLFFFICFTTLFHAQTLSLNGTVTNELNQPLPGTNIVEKGTNNGVVADFDGNFSIDVANNAVLIVSYIGFTTQEILINNQTNLQIQLTEDAAALDEVVIIGYGSRRKNDVTGAVSTVKKSYIKQQAAGDATRALQGSASGVTVVASARPGEQAQVRIRGLGTINSNEPLYVVDGVFGAQLPPTNQIESMQVLKDATSTAIYGSRGANGVILITTKTGRVGQPAKVELNIRTGIGTANSKYDLITDPALIGQQIWLEQTNDGITPNHAHFNFDPNDIRATTVNDYLFPNGGSIGDPATDPSLYVEREYPISLTNQNGTDWLKELYQPAPITDITLSVTGGSKKTSYALSGNYFKEEGVLKYNSFDRYAFRANTDSQVKDWLKIGQRLGVIMTQSKGNTAGFNTIIETSPLIPVRDIAGNFAGGIVGGGLNDGPNPLGNNFRQRKDERTALTATGNFYMEINPIKNTTFKSLFGYNTTWNSNHDPRFADPENTNGTTGNSLTETRSKNLTWNWTNTISYNKTFNELHNFELLLGTEATRFEFDQISAGREGFISTDDDFFVLSSGSENQTNDSDATAWALNSYFGRAYYSYDNKYMVEATIRSDRSSRFGKNSKWGNFPAISGGWVISNEGFLNDSNWIDHLKLRAGWGQSGNDRIGDYNGFSTFGSGLGASFYGIGGADGTIVQGFQSTAIGNPNAKWETTTSTNFAIDATLFNRINMTLDLWKKDTSDMLFPVEIPAVEGIANAPSVNIGDMENKGIDLELSYNGGGNNDGDFKYSLGFIFSKYNNKIKKLSNNDDDFIVGREQRSQRYTRAEIGTSFPEFFGYIVDGIFQTQEEADSHAPNGNYNQPGNLKIRDFNGDGVITADDRTYIGNPNPDFTAGLNIKLEYKNFDFSASLYTSQGNDAINYYNRFTRYGLFQGPKSADRLFRSWGSPYLDNNANAVLPKASSQTSFEQNTHSDLVEDASFIRLQNAQLGFNIPQNILDDMNISSMRIYLMATNLFTISDYSGLDAEVSVNRDNPDENIEINRGLDLGNWPAPKQIIVGLDIKL
ncbi:SusC/RagA family TonB-linked outer membrane protein [Aquimarina agarilytica]|uniref:SusC/RagA family TonB-linked outer membrane protein n=1 Tax=Aquimarina agarilytica TaxID=1087449 RepID=UPI000287E584|nr:TonB-dependent receptor [Aquimarina agarilytica]